MSHQDEILLPRDLCSVFLHLRGVYPPLTPGARLVPGLAWGSQDGTVWSAQYQVTEDAHTTVQTVFISALQ